MHLTSQQVLLLTEETLRDFLSRGIPEGLYLDYKEDLSRSSDKDAKREFLKDITAFANAAGGQMFLGVKEPSEGVSIDSRLIGLENGDILAQDLERLASSSIDPRIPGLRIVPIPLSNRKYCVVVHIPPSLFRPHMVSYEKHRSFYVRHSESSFPMTTHEIREAVLTSSSAESRARHFIQHRLLEAYEVLGDHQAAFFLQAMPLISPEPPLDILSTPFENVLRGEARRKIFPSLTNLASYVAPRPTIDGLLGQDHRKQPTWETEIHRTGYISLVFRDIKKHPEPKVDQFILHSGICDIFKAFCHILKEFLDVSGTDLPYLLVCVYLNANGTCLLPKLDWEDLSAPYKGKNIMWPEHFRATGSDPMSIAESLSVEMFNAFGYKEIL